MVALMMMMMKVVCFSVFAAGGTVNGSGRRPTRPLLTTCTPSLPPHCWTYSWSSQRWAQSELCWVMYSWLELTSYMWMVISYTHHNYGVCGLCPGDGCFNCWFLPSQLVYAAMSLMRWTDAVRSQSGIGIAGVLLVALSVAAGAWHLLCAGHHIQRIHHSGLYSRPDLHC